LVNKTLGQEQIMAHFDIFLVIFQGN